MKKKSAKESEQESNSGDFYVRNSVNIQENGNCVIILGIFN